MATFRSLFASATAAVALVTLARGLVARDRTPPHLANRLFLYGYEQGADNEWVSVAAVATISPAHFSIERTFSFGYWSTVASAANGNTKWLLLHNRNDGSLATGTIGPDFRFRRHSFYPPGTFPNWPYQSEVVDGRGYLFLSGATGQSSKPVVVGFAQVLDDGSFVEWWRTELDIPYPQNVVGLQNAHAWYENDATSARSTVYIFDVKHAQILSSRKFDHHLDGIVVDGERICLCTRDKATTEIYVLDDNHQLVLLRHTDYRADFYPEPLFAVASTPGAHLFYESAPFSDNLHHDNASVRVLEPDGLRITATARNEKWVWQDLAPC